MKPGDWVEHVSGELDDREVARVEGDEVWLYLATRTPSGPFPKKNYRVLE